ncbi:MAG TPA: OB-fold domain-containing protein [Streptosporangiaceae bacterium]|nr:OB-fold domain-containing protein [Streptosporangiaceae bacterium]
MTGDEASAVILAAAEKVRAAGPSSPRVARDPVNLPAIRNWTDAIGDANPVYTDADVAARSKHQGLVAPPAMVQVWTMPGLQPPPADDATDPLGQMMRTLDVAGYPAVVATNCAQTYHRYLRHGEVLSLQAELADVTGPKRTALGEGWFVTTKNIWYSGGEPVAEMDWRVLKYKPTSAASPDGGVDANVQPASLGPVMRPPDSPDTAFFWAGTHAGELRVQRCGECGALRHPPGPACLSCRATSNQGYVVAAGTGTVYSYVVHHHPPVPGKRLPLVIALVELTEGVRMMAELIGIEPDRVEVGMPVRTAFLRIDDDLVLPGWRPDDRRAPGALPELAIDVTPTVVVSTAIATRDFYPVHHDQAMARRSGSKDIFLNILTTTGLVQRYVTDWAGPDAVVRAVSVRLGVPCYAGDTLTFSGRASAEPNGEQVISVTGACSLGDHVTGTVRLAGPAASDGQR